MLMQHDYTAKSVLQCRWFPSRESLIDESSTTCCFLDETDDWTMVTGDAPRLASNPILHGQTVIGQSSRHMRRAFRYPLPTRWGPGATLSHTHIHPSLRRYVSKHLHAQLWMYGTKMAQGALWRSAIPRQACLISRVWWIAFFNFFIWSVFVSDGWKVCSVIGCEQWNVRHLVWF